MPVSTLDDCTYEEIAREGARLIDEFFYYSAENLLLWSPSEGPEDTALVIGDMFEPKDEKELFQRLVRAFFQKAGLQELSYVEYFEGGHDPIWVMLIKINRTVDLRVGIQLCRWASFGWSIQKCLRLHRIPKRQLDRTLKLLVPEYPRSDLKRRLDQLILPRSDELLKPKCGR